MTVARVVVMCGVLPLVWSPTRVSAEPLPITWSAPPGCPSLRDVTSWLEAVVPAELRTRLSGVTADVRITRIDRLYRAAIVVTHAAWTGEREVEGRRCEEVARSAIVIVSVSLAEAVEIATREVSEPSTPELPPAPAIPPGVEPEVEPETQTTEPPPTPNPPVVPSPPDTPRMPILIDAGAGLVFGFGTRTAAPRVTAGASIQLHAHATVAVRLRAIPRARMEHGAATADLALVTAGVEGCGRYAAGRVVHLVGCLALDAGTVVAAGTDIDETARGTAPWLSLALAPAVELGRRVRFRVSAELESRVVRPRLTVNGIGTVYHSPAVGGSLDLGLVILIP